MKNNPAPIQATSHRFVSFDKTPIHFLHYKAEQNIRANLIILHGAGEYAERYHDFSQYLASHEISVYAVDLRGYGKSGGPRAYVKSFDDFGKDVAALMRSYPFNNSSPTILFGHSMGGLIATYISSYVIHNHIQALILSSPCFGLTVQIPSYIEWAANIFASIHPKYLFPTNPIPDVLSHDPRVVQKHRVDPHICRYMSAGLYRQLTTNIKKRDRMSRCLTIPVAVFQAGDDRIVSREKSQIFLESVASDKKLYTEYDGLFHEILHETNPQRIYKDILSWINSYF